MDGPAIYPNAVVLGLFSAITTVLDIPPLVWHAKHRNIAATSLIFWIILLNITNFINAIIWPNPNMSSRFNGVGLCDIEVKYTVASWAGLPCAIAAIVRRLAKVMDPNNVVMAPSTLQKRRNLIIDILLVWACPIYLIGIHYVVQSNRYYIWSIAGCNPSLDSSWPSAILVFIWPCVFALVAGYYAVLLLIRLYRYRLQFRTILQAHNTTKSRFLRLFFISLICILVLIPLSFWLLAQNLTIGARGTYSWRRIHNPTTWNTVIYIDDGGIVLYDRWIRIGAGVLIFGFFGMGQDAVGMYKSWLVKIGLGKIFPSLHQRHDHRHREKGSGSGYGWFSTWSGKARSLLPSSLSSSATKRSTTISASSTHPMSPHNTNANSTGKDATLSRQSTSSSTTASTIRNDLDYDHDHPPSSPKSDRFFRPLSTSGPMSKTARISPARERVSADRPSDGLPRETVTAHAGAGLAGDGVVIGAGHGGRGVMVQKDLWTTKEVV